MQVLPRHAVAFTARHHHAHGDSALRLLVLGAVYAVAICFAVAFSPSGGGDIVPAPSAGLADH